jgi:TRAP-type mannitol/chloroaromatic compound transport system substrate-binding protein
LSRIGCRSRLSQRDGASLPAERTPRSAPANGTLPPLKEETMLRWFAKLAAVLAATLVLSAGAHAQQYKARIQTAVPAASIYFELLKRWADRVEKMSGGRLKMEILPDGAIVPAFEILDAVDKGVVEGGYAWTHYWSGKHPAAGIFSNPMAGAGVGLDQISHVAWLMEGGGNELYRKFYSDILKVNVEPFMIQPMGPDPLGWFKQPINSTADFKKMKYRSPPGITGEIFKEMGVAAVAMPGGEIVPAAQRGTIDAAEWIGPADDLNLGLQTVWKHYYLQGLHQSTDVGEVLFNKAFWNKLPPDIQEQVRVAAMASMMETYAFNVYRNAQAIVKLRNEFKVQIHDTPKDFYPEFVRATNVVLDRYAQKDPFFKQVLDSQKNFATTVVPYWTKIIDLYSGLGNAALQKK